MGPKIGVRRAHDACPQPLRSVELPAGVRGDALKLNLTSEDCPLSSCKKFRPTLRPTQLTYWCRGKA